MMDWRTRLGWLFRRNASERDLDEEMRAHLEIAVEENIEAGMTPEEARRAARRSFGNMTQAQESTREIWIIGWLDTLFRDLRFSCRVIRKHPWFSAAIVVTLALGIGVNTGIFSLVSGLLYRPLPFPGGDRFVAVDNTLLARGGAVTQVSRPDYRTFRDDSESFEHLEAVTRTTAVLSERGAPPDQYRMATITPGLFPMIGVRPALGRPMSDADAAPGAAAAVWISDGLWKGRYGSSDEVIGKTVRIDGEAGVIAGVMPPGFRFPQVEDVWMALRPGEESDDRESRPLTPYGMLKTGVSVTEAGTELSVIAARLAAEFPETNENLGVMVRAFREKAVGNARPFFLLILTLGGFVLLIACANVANMMLSRSLGRTREVSIRSAMGASRWQIVRQLLVESVLLSTLGGVLGLGLAVYGTRAFTNSMAVTDPPPYWMDFSPDATVFSYLAAVCFVSGVVFGLAPALRSSRPGLEAALKDGGRSSGGIRGGRLSAALVVFQFTVTVVLLAQVALFIRIMYETAASIRAVPAEQILTAAIALPAERYPGPEDRRLFYERLLPVMAALPGVRNAAIASRFPSGGAMHYHVEVEGVPSAEYQQLPLVSVVRRTPEFLAVADVPILAGRDIEESDGAPGREVAVVTEAFAARLWPGQSPLGKRFRLPTREDPGPWITVAGVCGNLTQEPDEEHRPPVVFTPLRQQASGEPYLSEYLLLRTAGPASSLSNALRAEVQRLDEDLPLREVMSLKDAAYERYWGWTVFGSLFGILALSGLLMASTGIYGVLAHATARRTREIGVRLAFGATSGSILRMVLTRGVWQIGIALCLGLPGAIVVAHLTTAVMDEVSIPTRPLEFVAVPLVLSAVGLFACWLPARRASKLEPVQALRHE